MKRQTAGEFWPVLATTTQWPAVRYTGIDGSASVTSPPGIFPTPPIVLGPDAPDPIDGGSWPKLAVRYISNLYDSPQIDPCVNYNVGCMSNPWITGDPPFSGVNQPNPNQNPNDDDDDNEPYEACPLYAIIGPRETSTTTTTTPTPSPTPSPTPTATKIGNPMLNTVNCYNSGERHGETCECKTQPKAFATTSNMTISRKIISTRAISPLTTTAALARSRSTYHSKSWLAVLGFGQMMSASSTLVYRPTAATARESTESREEQYRTTATLGESIRTLVYKLGLFLIRRK